LIQRRENAFNTAIPQTREESTLQEWTGGACSKMRALRNGTATQIGLSAGILENCTAVAGAIISGAAAV